MSTGFSSEIGTKLRDWAVGQAGGSCYSQAALSSNDSKTRYSKHIAAESTTGCPHVLQYRLPSSVWVSYATDGTDRWRPSAACDVVTFGDSLPWPSAMAEIHSDTLENLTAMLSSPK